MFHIFNQSHHAPLSPPLCGLNSRPLPWRTHVPHHRGNWHEQGREDSLDGRTLSVKGTERHFLAVTSHWGSPWIYGQLIAFDLVWPSFSTTALLQWSLKQLHQNHLVHWDVCVSLVKFHPTDLGPSQSQRYFWISSLSFAIIHLHFASLIMLIRPGLVTRVLRGPWLPSSGSPNH